MTAAHSDDNEPEIPPEVLRAIEAEIESLKQQGKLARIEPRCKVCREKPIRILVNQMLRQGLNRAGIVRSLEGINELREPKDRITYDNVYHHAKRHFNVEAPSQAIYDNVLAEYEAQDQTELEKGVGTRVNVYSYLKTMMLKGYEHLRDDDTVVPFEAGAKAAKDLHELTRRDAGTHQVAAVIAQMNRIITAMQEIVPAEYHDAILARVEGVDNAVVGQVIEGSVGVDPFDPDTIGDDDDDDEDY